MLANVSYKINNFIVAVLIMFATTYSGTSLADQDISYTRPSADFMHSQVIFRQSIADFADLTPQRMEMCVNAINRKGVRWKSLGWTVSNSTYILHAATNKSLYTDFIFNYQSNGTSLFQKIIFPKETDPSTNRTLETEARGFLVLYGVCIDQESAREVKAWAREQLSLPEEKRDVVFLEAQRDMEAQRDGKSSPGQ